MKHSLLGTHRNFRFLRHLTRLGKFFTYDMDCFVQLRANFIAFVLWSSNFVIRRVQNGVETFSLLE